MRLFILSIFALAGSLYVYAAFESYQEELHARSTLHPEPGVSERDYLHPEANLRHVRESIAAEEYGDELRPYLERALEQAPSFYQPSFLVAAYYANRLERPELIEQAFEAAIVRFPSNGRLRLTYAEWLLTPRATAPYRSYRTSDTDPLAARRRALEHIASGTTLEPDLARRAVDLLLRFGVPISGWAAILPPGEHTTRLVLRAVDRSPRDRDARRNLLEEHLSTASETDTLRTAERYADKWGEPELALAAAERWHGAALAERSGSEVTNSTLRLAHHYLERREADRAYRIVRSTVADLEQMQLTEYVVDLLVEAASLYLRQKRLVMAESLLTEAATMSPHRAQIFLGLAQAHHLAGERDAALRELERVLEIDPANQAARSMLDAMMSESEGIDR